MFRKLTNLLPKCSAISCKADLMMSVLSEALPSHRASQPWSLGYLCLQRARVMSLAVNKTCRG